jgi:hypothetical protein
MQQDDLPHELRVWAREIIDKAWNEATESKTVPSTDWADRIIDSASRPSVAANNEVKRLRKAITTVLGWDCLHPEPATHLCSDFPWLKRLLQEALAGRD